MLGRNTIRRSYVLERTTVSCFSIRAALQTALRHVGCIEARDAVFGTYAGLFAQAPRLVLKVDAVMSAGI